MASSTNSGPGAGHTGNERPVWDGSTGEQVGHSHESLGESLEEGEHEWHRENSDGTETVETYTVDDDHW